MTKLNDYNFSPTPGPNVFWSLAVLDYCRQSGDDDFLHEMILTLRAAIWFLTTQNFMDNTKPPTFQKMGLIASPGSLWIDPLKRGNSPPIFYYYFTFV